MNLRKNIPLIKPYITKEVKDRVCQVLDSGYLTEGSVTREFENAVRDYIGCGFAIAVCNCTVGLELSLRATGIGPGDEVIVPDYTYPATADVVRIVGAKTVIIDVDRENMLIDYDSLERAITPRTKAVIPVSIFGNPLDYDRLNRIKERYQLLVIEDAACSLGARYRKTRVGNLADISVFSFHPRKFITTGEGGVVTTSNRQWAEWMVSYKHFGMGTHDSRVATQFERIGTNYKLSDIQAAAGLVQMNHIDELLTRRQELARNYIKLLEKYPHIEIPDTTTHGEHSYQSFCVFLDNRNGVMGSLREQGIEVQIGTYALHMQKAFEHNPDCRVIGPMEGSKYAFDHCLTLPLYHELSFEDQTYIVSKIEEAAL